MTNNELILAIRAEIERRKVDYLNRSYTFVPTAMQQLLDFIDTIESEKPLDIDFEQELYNHFGQIKDFTLGMRIGQYFYNLGRDSVPLPEDTVLFNKGVAEGKRLMMEEAVEGYVNYYEDSGGILMAEAQVGCPYHNGDKVRIIVLPKED